MRYMLDTNICIPAIKKKPTTVIRNFLKHDPEDLCISAFLSSIAILKFDSYAAEEYAKIRAELERKGTPIGATMCLNLPVFL